MKKLLLIFLASIGCFTVVGCETKEVDNEKDQEVDTDENNTNDTDENNTGDSSDAETPDAGTGTETPDAGTGTETPDAGTGTETPDAGTGTETPDAGTENQTPDAGAGTETPDAGAGTGTPDAGVGTETPDVDNESGLSDTEREALRATFNTYGFESYYKVASGVPINLEIKLMGISPGAAWGKEVFFFDKYGVDQKIISNEAFNTEFLFFSFPNNIAENLVVGETYIFEVVKGLFPPNSKPQFGIAGSESIVSGSVNDVDTENALTHIGKYCNVLEPEKCSNLVNTDFGDLTQDLDVDLISDFTDSTTEAVIDVVLYGKNISGYGDYLGFEGTSGKVYFDLLDTTSYEEDDFVIGNKYRLTLKNITQFTFGTTEGTFIHSLEITNVELLEEVTPPEENTSNKIVFSDFGTDKTSGEFEFEFKVVSLGNGGNTVIEDSNGVTSTDSGLFSSEWIFTGNYPSGTGMEVGKTYKTITKRTNYNKQIEVVSFEEVTATEENTSNKIVFSDFGTDKTSGEFEFEFKVVSLGNGGNTVIEDSNGVTSTDSGLFSSEWIFTGNYPSGNGMEVGKTYKAITKRTNYNKQIEVVSFEEVV